jgi:hypothetical protein
MAFKLVQKHSSLNAADVYLPYDKYIALQDQFDFATTVKMIIYLLINSNF